MTERGTKTVRWWQKRLERFSDQHVSALYRAAQRKDGGIRPFVSDPYVIIALRNVVAQRGAQ